MSTPSTDSAGIKHPDPEEYEYEEWPCNDCGELIPKGDDLCNSCYQKQLEREEWDLLHPEARCPPRE